MEYHDPGRAIGEGFLVGPVGKAENGNFDSPKSYDVLLLYAHVIDFNVKFVVFMDEHYTRMFRVVARVWLKL